MNKEQLFKLKQARDLLHTICKEQADCIECPLQNNYPFNMCWCEGIDSVYFYYAKEMLFTEKKMSRKERSNKYKESENHKKS